MRGGRRSAAFGVASALTVALALAVPANAGFVTVQIEVQDPPGSPAFAFAPDDASLSIASGARVRWSRGPGGDARHSVTQAARLFRLPPTFGEIDFTRRASAGRFVYFCEVHGSPEGGMNGVLRIAPVADDDPKGTPPFTVAWAPDTEREMGKLFDVRFRRQGASGWTIWKNDTPREAAVFGGADRPLRVVEGRTYEFQARSERANNPSKRSGWSPVLVVQAVEP